MYRYTVYGACRDAFSVRVCVINRTARARLGTKGTCCFIVHLAFPSSSPSPSRSLSLARFPCRYISVSALRSWRSFQELRPFRASRSPHSSCLPCIHRFQNGYLARFFRCIMLYKPRTGAIQELVALIEELSWLGNRALKIHNGLLLYICGVVASESYFFMGAWAFQFRGVGIRQNVANISQGREIRSFASAALSRFYWHNSGISHSASFSSTFVKFFFEQSTLPILTNTIIIEECFIITKIILYLKLNSALHKVNE